MRKIQIVGLAFAAIFVYSMVSASGASAFTLWDECMKVPTGTGEFDTADCLTKVSSLDWSWLAITAPTAVVSLLVLLELSSGGVTLDCEGFTEGTVGGGAADEVTLILNENLEEVTLEKPTECKVIAGSSLCTEPALAGPHGLPWKTELVAAGDLLGPHAGGENPGWEVKCANGLTNLCERADTILKVENLTDELEVDLTFPGAAEKATCTNIFAKEGEVKGTVSIFLPNALGEPDRALQAM
jgi:hypothetical protein